MPENPSDLLFNKLPIIDVRSPGEFAKGHVAGAVSMPLFSDEERHEVGLCYKTKGQEAAIKMGLDFVGPKMSGFIDEANRIAPERQLNMYCWRGGMRSGSMAWLLKTAGFKVNVIKGGYKAWRNEAMEILARPFPLITLGGLTGVGKTEILHALEAQGQQVLDLEGMANHTGSAFSSTGKKQPSSEEFENQLAFKLLNFDLSRPIWIEDESKLIGHVYINMPFHQGMRKAPFVLITKSTEERVQTLCNLYGEGEMGDLKHAFKKIERRIGGQYMKAAFEYIDQGNLDAAARIALQYYDNAYTSSMNNLKRNPIAVFSLMAKSPEESAEILTQWMIENKLKLFA